MPIITQHKWACGCVWVICAMVSGERFLCVYELNCGCVCVCFVRFETVYYYFIFNSIISHDNKPIHEYDWRNGNVWVMLLLLCQCDRVSRRIHHVMLDVYSTAAVTCNVWMCRTTFRGHFSLSFQWTAEQVLDYCRFTWMDSCENQLIFGVSCRCPSIILWACVWAVRCFAVQLIHQKLRVDFPKIKTDAHLTARDWFNLFLVD